MLGPDATMSLLYFMAVIWSEVSFAGGGRAKCVKVELYYCEYVVCQLYA